jgi:hypothetical protein
MSPHPTLGERREAGSLARKRTPRSGASKAGNRRTIGLIRSACWKRRRRPARAGLSSWRETSTTLSMMSPPTTTAVETWSVSRLKTVTEMSMRSSGRAAGPARRPTATGTSPRDLVGSVGGQPVLGLGRGEPGLEVRAEGGGDIDGVAAPRRRGIPPGLAGGTPTGVSWVIARPFRVAGAGRSSQSQRGRSWALLTSGWRRDPPRGRLAGPVGCLSLGCPGAGDIPREE